MSDKLRNPVLLRAKVRARYGKPGAEVEEEYRTLLTECKPPAPVTVPGTIGRRKKG